MACHLLHPVFMGLKLGYPTRVQGASTMLMTDSAPSTESVQLIFPARPNVPGIKMDFPEVQVTWMDGGMKPMKPSNWPEGRDMNDGGGGVIFHGTRDKLICGCYGKNPWLLSGRVPKVEESIPRIKTSHEQDWIRAAKESPENRVETASPFSQAGPFNEMVVMGVLAVRLQDLNKELIWDGPNMQFTNIHDNEEIKFCLDNGMVITNGNPTFNEVDSDPLNAKKFAADLIRHKYREGWSLPDMPA